MTGVKKTAKLDEVEDSEKEVAQQCEGEDLSQVEVDISDLMG